MGLVVSSVVVIHATRNYMGLHRALGYLGILDQEPLYDLLPAEGLCKLRRSFAHEGPNSLAVCRHVVLLQALGPVRAQLTSRSSW